LIHFDAAPPPTPDPAVEMRLITPGSGSAALYKTLAAIAYARFLITVFLSKPHHFLLL
jgi:hypothetical protein